MFVFLDKHDQTDLFSYLFYFALRKGIYLHYLELFYSILIISCVLLKCLCLNNITIFNKYSYYFIKNQFSKIFMIPEIIPSLTYEIMESIIISADKYLRCGHIRLQEKILQDIVTPVNQNIG